MNDVERVKYCALIWATPVTSAGPGSFDRRAMGSVRCSYYRVSTEIRIYLIQGSHWYFTARNLTIPKAQPDVGHNRHVEKDSAHDRKIRRHGTSLQIARRRTRLKKNTVMQVHITLSRITYEFAGTQQACLRYM